MRISFRSVFNSLRYKKARTILTIISIGIGVFSVVIITAISNLGKEAINYELDSLGIGGVIITTTNAANIGINTSDLNVIRDYETVQAATPVLMNVSNTIIRNNNCEIALWGVNSDACDVIRIKTLYGRLINENDVSSCENVCVIDSKLAIDNYKRENIVGKSIRILIGSTYETFKVVGIVESGGNVLQGLVGDYIPSFVYIPYTTMQMYDFDMNIQNLALKLDPTANTENIAKQIINDLEAKNEVVDAYKYEDISKQKETLNNMLDIFTFVLGAVAFVSIIVAGIGIMTIMMVSVSERTREIGIKKAIGAKKIQIMLEFMTESLVISLLGSLAGGLIGQLIAYLGATMLGMNPKFDFFTIIICILGALAISVVFGIYPAYTAAKMKPVDALKFD